MQDLALGDRPREKLERAGVIALGDNELLSIVIGHGTAGASALAIANRLLTAAGGTHGLTRLTAEHLTQVPGVGRALATRVLAAVELGRRTLLLSPRARPRFLTPRDAALFLLPQFGAHPVERFGVMMLDTRLRLVRTQLISVGSVDASLAHPRDVFREATIAGAAALVLFHNHPSGDPTPSRDDLDLTRRLVAAGRVLGIDVVDHVILADTHYCSMKESGWGPWHG
ncbi:MAG: RadC family protein [Acidobacteriota bacterium]